MGGEEGADLINGVAVRGNVHEPVLKYTKECSLPCPKAIIFWGQGQMVCLVDGFFFIFCIFFPLLVLLVPVP